MMTHESYGNKKGIAIKTDSMDAAMDHGTGRCYTEV